jgi:hypothetical protein
MAKNSVNHLIESIVFAFDFVFFICRSCEFVVVVLYPNHPGPKMLEHTGLLVRCSDEAITMYLRRLDERRRFILGEVQLDTLHLLIDPAAREYILDKLNDLMDQIAFDRERFERSR